MRISLGHAGLALAVTLAQPAIAAESLVKVSSPQVVKGVGSVIIGAFNVGFIFESVDNTKKTGGMIGAFGGATRAKSVLAGVTPAMMQAITDAAYADFTARLQASGFTVAPADGLFSTPDFTRVKPLAAPYDASVQLDKHSTGKATFLKPAAVSTMFMLPGDLTASGFSGMGVTMAAGTNQYVVSQYAKSSGQTIVDVTYLVDFSDVRRPGAFSMAGVQVNSGMSVTSDFSRVTLIAPSGKSATVTLNDPAAVEGDFADKADTTKDKAVQSAMNIACGVAAAFGAGTFQFGKSRTFTFTAKPAYVEGAVKAAALANDRIVTQLAALR
ncbi:MAG: hypothetical protein JF628_13730 [Sphingomonas sp.]|nr:hypothetical protein [Sphingomonas sp.]